eukprot:TRINITY_DN53694_c0_g1_i1.p1 TRINITY_DN53694_c0_g1~~TRINITY_DN53694_c0_g1_i1.p1  ORF type:complete len:151 (-),score=37.82 TRINITY_DN53694_c0_g1_i1:109-561(-)
MKIITTLFFCLFIAVVFSQSDFLKENAKKEGVIVTSTGLQYKILSGDSIGQGRKPTRSSKVDVHYEGSLPDGTVFDSSIKRGKSLQFGVTQVISGWTEMLQLMSPGDSVECYIPSELGYGARGAGRSIPPNSDLIFTIELLDIIGGHDEL